MPKFLSVFCLQFILLLSQAQPAQITPQDMKTIKDMEDSMRVFGDSMVNSLSTGNRVVASYRIIRCLKTALKVKNSFQYQFDSLLPMEIIEPPDHSFRIFTWFTVNDEQIYKYYGAIQVRSDTLKLFPLIDYSDFTDKPEDKTVDNENWIGALYYNIQTVKAGKQTYYTLLGSDGNTSASNKKVLDVLWFAKDGKPRFGAPIFEVSKKGLQNRFYLEFSDEVWATLRFDPIENKIVYDHVEPPSEAMEGFYPQYLPDGTYEGFQWKKGKWHHIDMIDYEKRQAGDVPNISKKEKPNYGQPVTPSK
jgi:hypothetical protein